MTSSRPKAAINSLCCLISRFLMSSAAAMTPATTIAIPNGPCDTDIAIPTMAASMAMTNNMINPPMGIVNNHLTLNHITAGGVQ